MAQPTGYCLLEPQAPLTVHDTRVLHHVDPVTQLTGCKKPVSLFWSYPSVAEVADAEHCQTCFPEGD